MSRPHDGHRAFLPFGNPFRMIFPKESYLSPKLMAVLSSFEQTLAENLKKLKPEDISDVFSLSWLRHAMQFLSETHINIKSLITDLEFPVSNWDEKWMDIYLDSSVKLLDICIALSSELSRLDQGQLLLQYALHTFDTSCNFPSSEQLNRAHASLCDWRQQINSRSPKLEGYCVILQGPEGTLNSAKVKNSAKGKVLMRALYGVKAVTIFVCSVFSSALSGCLKPFSKLIVPAKFFWAESFNDLQADVLKEIMSQVSREKVMVLKELEAVEKCVERVHVLSNSICRKEEETKQHSNNSIHEETATFGESTGQEEKESWQESVKELAEGTERLSLGLDLLSQQVEQYFEIVLTGRDALLSNLRASDDVIMQESNNNGESL